MYEEGKIENYLAEACIVSSSKAIDSIKIVALYLGSASDVIKENN